MKNENVSPTEGLGFTITYQYGRLASVREIMEGGLYARSGFNLIEFELAAGKTRCPDPRAVDIDVLSETLKTWLDQRNIGQLNVRSTFETQSAKTRRKKVCPSNELHALPSVRLRSFRCPSGKGGLIDDSDTGQMGL